MLSYVMPFGFLYGSSSWLSMLRRRSSAGSMPMRRAAMSSVTSRASVSNCHGPLYGARPAVLVYIVFVENAESGILYGPGKIIPTAAAVITGHGVGYAPESCRWSIFTAWM